MSAEKQIIKEGLEKSLAQKVTKKGHDFICMANLPSRHRLMILAMHDLAAQADLLIIMSPKPHPANSFTKEYCWLIKCLLGEAESL